PAPSPRSWRGRKGPATTCPGASGGPTGERLATGTPGPRSRMPPLWRSAASSRSRRWRRAASPAHASLRYACNSAGLPFCRAAANSDSSFMAMFLSRGHNARYPFMRRRGRKHVRRELFFFRIIARHGGVQPGAGVAPATVGGGQGNVQAFGRLLQSQAGEEAQLDELGLERVMGRELLQRVVQGQQLVGGRAGTLGIEVHVLAAPAAAVLD